MVVFETDISSKRGLVAFIKEGVTNKEMKGNKEDSIKLTFLVSFFVTSGSAVLKKTNRAKFRCYRPTGVYCDATYKPVCSDGKAGKG